MLAWHLPPTIALTAGLHCTYSAATMLPTTNKKAKLSSLLTVNE